LDKILSKKDTMLSKNPPMFLNERAINNNGRQTRIRLKTINVITNAILNKIKIFMDRSQQARTQKFIMGRGEGRVRAWKPVK
jgi:hypothetical protein